MLPPEDDTPVEYGPLSIVQTVVQQYQAEERATEAAARTREAAAKDRSADLPSGSLEDRLGAVCVDLGIG